MKYFHEIAFKATQFAKEQKQDLVWLAAAVASMACELSFCYSKKIFWNGHRSWNNEVFFDDKKVKWVNMVNDSLFDWMMAINESYDMLEERKPSLASYVLSYKASGCDKSLLKIIDKRDFVSSFKNAVSRLMDLGSDMQTLINIIRTITVNNEGSYSLDVDFVSLLNHKIVEKRYDYNEAKQRMYVELRDSDYMASYKEVLKRVINQWGF